MKNVITPSAVFVPASRTIDFSSYSGFDVRRLMAVINTSRGVILFAQGVPALGYSAIAGAMLTLVVDTTTGGHQGTDLLSVIYDTASLDVTVPPLAYTGSATLVVQSTGSSVIIPAGTYKRAIQLQSLPGSGQNIWLRADGQAVAVRTGILLAPNQGSVLFGAHGLPVPTGDITAIAEGTGPFTIAVAGG